MNRSRMKAIGLALLVCAALLALVLVGCGKPESPVISAPIGSRGLQELKLSATTDGDGDGTATSSFDVYGQLYAVEWLDGDCADGVDAVLSSTGTAGNDYTLLTLTDANNDAWYYPRHQVHGNDGTALTLDGTRIAYDMSVLFGTPQLVVASGGATKTCESVIYYLE